MGEEDSALRDRVSRSMRGGGRETRRPYAGLEITCAPIKCWGRGGLQGRVALVHAIVFREGAYTALFSVCRGDPHDMATVDTRIFDSAGDCCGVFYGGEWA